MGTIHKHSTQSRNLDIMTNKNWTCIKMYKNIKRYQKYKNIKVDNILNQNLCLVNICGLAPNALSCEKAPGKPAYLIAVMS